MKNRPNCSYMSLIPSGGGIWAGRGRPWGKGVFSFLAYVCDRTLRELIVIGLLNFIVTFFKLGKLKVAIKEAQRAVGS